MVRKPLTKIALAAALSVTYSAASAQSLEVIVQQAIAMYPSIVAAQAKVDASRADIDRARAGHMPQISVSKTSNSYASGSIPTSVGNNLVQPAVRLNLWSGGRIQADVEHSEALTIAAELQKNATVDDVASLAAETYLTWAKSLELVKLAEKNLEAHRTTYNDISRISEVDTGRRIDLQQAQVRMQNATLALVQRKTELQQAKQRLMRFWGDVLPTVPTGLQSGQLVVPYRSLNEAMLRVDDTLPPIATQNAQVTAAEKSVRMAYAQYSPTLDALITKQYNANINAFERFSQLQLNMPLYSGGATSAGVDAAKHQVIQAQAMRDEARIIAREKLSLSWEEWDSAKSRVDVGHSQATTGDTLVDGYRQQFRLGRRQLLDLLNIQAEQFNYQSAVTTARYDEQIARVHVLTATSELAQRFAKHD